MVIESAPARHREQRVLDDVGEGPRDQRAVDECARQRRYVGSQIDAIDQSGLVGSDDFRNQLRMSTAARLAVGDDAKFENSAEICRSRWTWVRMDADAVLEDGTQGFAAIGVHALEVFGGQLNRRQRILDFVRDLPRHFRPRFQPMGPLELSALRLELAGHAVERIHQPLHLVG